MDPREDARGVGAAGPQVGPDDRAVAPDLKLLAAATSSRDWTLPC